MSTCPEAGSAGGVSQQRPRDKKAKILERNKHPHFGYSSRPKLSAIRLGLDLHCFIFFGTQRDWQLACLTATSLAAENQANRDTIDTPLISFAELWSLITRREQNTHGLPGLHLRRGEQGREGTGTVQLLQHPGCCTSTALFPAERIKRNRASLEQGRRFPLRGRVSRGKRNFAALNNRLLKSQHFPLKHALGLLSTDTMPGSLMGPKGQNLSPAASNPWGTRTDSHQHLHRPVQGQPSSPGYIQGNFKDKIALTKKNKKKNPLI